MIEERAYQERTCADVAAHWDGGARSVLVVSPPGSGKTEIAFKIIRAVGARRVLWVVHTRELAAQAIERLAAEFRLPVGAIMGGHVDTPDARITVAVVHSLLGHEPLEGIDLIVLDEAHHYLADKWNGARFKAVGANPKVLGLTATPERDDGRPLGDMFERLVVAASYSELREGGWIVPARVYSPKKWLRSRHAQHAIDAWFAFSGQRQTIAFMPSIESARTLAYDFSERLIRAAELHSEMSDTDRLVAMEDFQSGRAKVLCTVMCAIEGLNIPSVGCVLLGRSFDFIGGFLQATGRVLRAHPGKRNGIVIDLTGACTPSGHGLPDQDREYKLRPEKGESPISGGSPTGGGGSVIIPEVVGLEMRLIATGHEDDAPEPVPVPLPDPARARTLRKIDKAVRSAHTRFGADAAAKLRAQMEAMYL